jgi:hypothetical protein
VWRRGKRGDNIKSLPIPKRRGTWHKMKVI